MTSTTHAPRIETREGCTLVFGSLTLPQLDALCRDGTPDDVLCPDLAYLLGASFAFGTPTAIQSLTQRVRAEKVAGPMPTTLAALEPEAQAWAVAGEVGTSSATIFAWMTGVTLPIHHTGSQSEKPADVPYDPEDLRRCRLLLEAVPSFQRRFDAVMPQVSATWEALVKAWPQLCEAMDAECPHWREPGEPAICRVTYRLLHSLLAE